MRSARTSNTVLLGRGLRPEPRRGREKAASDPHGHYEREGGEARRGEERQREDGGAERGDRPEATAAHVRQRDCGRGEGERLDDEPAVGEERVPERRCDGSRT